MPLLRKLVEILPLAALLAGCAREAGEPQTPAPGWAAGWVLPAGEYEFPPKTLPLKISRSKGLAGARPATRGNTPKPPPPSPLRFAAAPGVPTYADGRPRPL